MPTPPPVYYACPSTPMHAEIAQEWGGAHSLIRLARLPLSLTGVADASQLYNQVVVGEKS